MMYAGLAGAVCCCLAMIGTETGIIPVWAGLLALGIAGVAACTGRRRPVVVIIAGILAISAVGVLRMDYAMKQYEQLPHYLANGQVIVRGEIAEQKRSFPTDKGQMGRYVLAGKEFAFADDGIFQPFHGNIYITVPEQEVLVPQTPVQFTGHVKAITYYRNDGVYDALHRDKEQSVFLKAYSEDAHSLVITGEPSGWRYRVYVLREQLTNWFKTVLLPVQAHVLSSLLFGGHYDELPPELLESFSTTGLIHILSVSGSHMALLLSVIQLLGSTLGLRHRALFLVSAVFVLSYGALAEFTAPVVRSAVMGLIAAYSVTVRRDYVSCQALGIAVLGMVFYSPYLVYDLSFRLSCGASAGIILLQPKIVRYIGFLPMFLRNAIGICLSAQAFVLPVICANFFALPVYTVIANLLIAPVLDMVIVLGLAAAVLSIPAPVVSQGILHVIAVLLDAGIRGNYFLASLPYSRFWIGSMPVWCSAAWYIGIITLVVSPWRRVLRGCACIVMVCGFLWHFWQEPEMKVMVFDLGNDQGTCVTLPDKSSYVWYNKSEWSNPEQAAVVLAPALRYHGIFRLAGCTVTGHHAAMTGAQLEKLFTIDSPVQYREKTAYPVGIHAGEAVYTLYDTSAHARWPQTGCIEIRQPAMFREHEFPGHADALIVHGKSGPHSQVYTEWLEQAAYLGIPVYSPGRDGQITALYRNGTWLVKAYGGDSV